MALHIHVSWGFFLNTFRSDSYKLTKEKNNHAAQIRSWTTGSTDSELIQF